jgi:hypothetical protein
MAHRYAEDWLFLEMLNLGRSQKTNTFFRKSLLSLQACQAPFVGVIAPRSRTRDEGRPLGAGLQEQASNYSKLLRSRAVVVSVGGKGTA